MSAGRPYPHECPDGPHRAPEGPNEDIMACLTCGSPTWTMRPENEQFGLHYKDCSLDQFHSGECEHGGSGHPPVEKVRGYWLGMEEDIEAERARFR